MVNVNGVHGCGLWLILNARSQPPDTCLHTTIIVMPPSSTSSSLTVTATNVRLNSNSSPNQQPTPNSNSRIPVTPAVLRSIFASSRSILEERSISRVAFFRFTGFLLSCIAISLAASRSRAFKSGAALLGVSSV
ncbi:hypothetical protein QCA50_000938 [Cerrena zonata]|uniref:Uncharacterized protein n=1 Tax=Cerrena zonata TaxID=2478898 RepID=A0AAW0GVV4_9APHY